VSKLNSSMVNSSQFIIKSLERSDPDPVPVQNRLDPQHWSFASICNNNSFFEQEPQV
jgi:hypothetical protein